MNKNKAKALAEGAICSLFSLALVLIGIFVPSLMLWMTMLSGIPMMYLAMRHGVRILIASWVVSVLILYGITGSLFSAGMMGVMCFLPGMVLGYTLRTQKRFATIIFAGAAVLLVGMVLQLAIFNEAGGGHGIADVVNRVIEANKQQIILVMESLENQLPLSAQELRQAVDAAMKSTKEAIFLYLPAFLIGSAVVMSYLIFMLGSFVLHRTRPIRIIYQPFWAIRAPKSMCYLALILFLVGSSTTKMSIPMAAVRNMTALFSAYFAVCGVSIVDNKFKKKIPSGYARGLIYGLVICIGYLFLGMIFQVMRILGIIDGFTGSWTKEGRFGNE